MNISIFKAGAISGFFLASLILSAETEFYKYTNYNPSDKKNSISYEGFANPSGKARPQTWWHWINGNITREGIERDLEAMSQNGYGAAIIFNISDPHEGDLAFNSPEWFDTFKFTVEAAQKRGMEIGIHNCDGWSEAGGPWVKPEDSMKKVVWTIADVDTADGKALKLGKPRANLGFYRDIAVVAWKTKKPSASSLKDAKILPANANTSFWAPNGLQSISDGDFDTLFALGSKDMGKSSYGMVFEFPNPVEFDSAFICVRCDWSSNSPIFLEVSDDNASYKPVARLDIPSSSGAVKFKPAAGKYWRLMRYTNAERKQDVPMQREAVIFDFELVSKGGYPAYASYIDGMRTKAGLDNFLRGGFKRGQSDVPKDSILDSKDVVIFRGGVSEDGSFKGKLPPGKWRVMRLGYTSTNVHIHPATKGGFGLEVDKFSAGALERHFNSYPAKMISAAESNAGKVFKYIETDSWECGTQTWTESFDEHFKKMHGYDMLKYVPVFAGECIDSPEDSDAFLSDLRVVYSKLINDNFYGKFGELVRSKGLLYETEPCGSFFMSDVYSTYRVADIPQNEIWQDERKIGYYAKPYSGCVSSGVASVANFYGKEMTTCESLTAKKGNWADSPLSLKGATDTILLNGYNTMVFHSYVNQPDERVPGWAMTPWGTTLNRKVTWWKLGKPFFDYIARVQYMMQKGRSAANILIVDGDEIPQTGGSVDIPDNIEIDRMNGEGVRDFLKVEGGKFTSPGRMAYEFLALSEGKYFSLETLRKLKEYVLAGGKICGSKLKKYSTLRGGESAKKEWDSLNSELFGDGKKSVRKIGSGLVFSGYSARETASELGLAPSFFDNATGDSEGILWRKRISPDGQIYYWLVNSSSSPRSAVGSFNVVGMSAQLWDPETGKRRGLDVAAEEGGRTLIPIEFNPYSGVFVVFKRGVERRVEKYSLDGSEVFPNAKGASQDSSKVSKNFTIAFTATPAQDRKLSEASQNGIMDTSGQPFAFFPEGMHHKLGESHCGAGVSVGKNSIGVYEHSANFLSCVLFADVPVPPKSRIAVVYRDNVPSIWLNGKLVAQAKSPSKRSAHIPQRHRSSFDGTLKDVILSPTALSAEEIAADSRRKRGDGEDAVNPRLRVKGGKLFAEFFGKGKIDAVMSDGTPLSLEVSSVYGPLEIKPPFDVEFNPAMGAPKSVKFGKLESWTDNKDAGVKNYSGTAIYRKTFNLPSIYAAPDVRAYIEVDCVAEIAKFSVNGKPAGTMWKPPYRLDITRLLKPGENSLEISVANTWVNRCLYDASLPPEKRLTWSNTMNIHYPPIGLKNPSPMAWSQGALQSGLIGKMKVRFSKIVSEQ